MQAVRELHSRLDDDKDGQVDSEESEEVTHFITDINIFIN